MLPEAWILLSKTPEVAVVGRSVAGKMCIYTVQDRGKGWRIYAIRFSKMNPGANLTPERLKQYIGQCLKGKGLCNAGDTHKNGIRLTCSRLHTILLDYAEGRRA
jgi:hypothetical protein